MRHIILPDDKPRRLVFYLSMEEFAARELGGGFFLWQSRPTVIIGRNQDMEAEVNLEFCKANGVEVYRRKSGGGCVYSDEGNLMLSHVTEGTSVQSIFAGYLKALCKALQGLGIQAVSTSNNDVLVQGRKVSGNAFFLDRGMSMVHGTLLYDSDFSMLEKAITPSREKLDSHGVKSVRQRVANLREFGLGLSMTELKAYLIESFCDSEYVLGDAEIAAIEKIEKSYLKPAFLLGKVR